MILVPAHHRGIVTTMKVVKPIVSTRANENTKYDTSTDLSNKDNYSTKFDIVISQG